MRIDRSSVQDLATTKDRKTAGPTPTDPQGRAPGAAPGVVVSGTVAQAAASSDRAQAHASDKVESLRAAVADGRYHVDVEKLAERIIADEVARAGSAK